MDAGKGNLAYDANETSSFLWFSPGIWKILAQQIFSRPTHFRRRKGHLDGFSSLATSRETLFSLWNSSEGTEHGRFHVSLIFSTTSSEVYAKVEPCCCLKLCWIFGVRRTKFTALEEPLNLLFRDGPAFYAQHP